MSRIEALLAMRERNPADGRVLFALALEYEKAERWDEVAAALGEYLATTDDQGNAWGRLATALLQLGRDDDAREALRRGFDAASRHGHPGMAAEFEDRLSDLGEGSSS